MSECLYNIILLILAPQKLYNSGNGCNPERYTMNTMFNFNQVMGIENETAPEPTPEKKEMTTFQKVVVTAAGVGVIAGAALITMKAADHAVGEVKAGVEGFKVARAKSKADKSSKKAAEMAAFKQSLINEGFSEADAIAMVKAEYGLED